MHAVVVRVNVHDREAAGEALRATVVPQVSSAPGFVSGYWTRKEGSHTGLSMMVFESQEAAQAASEQIGSMDVEAVTVDDVEVREVIASA
jgi:heme-degrading monooxygenase HmoA